MTIHLIDMTMVLSVSGDQLCGMWLKDEKTVITGSHVELPCCCGSPAGTLTTLSSPTGAAGPVDNTPQVTSYIMSTVT